MSWARCSSRSCAAPDLQPWQLLGAPTTELLPPFCHWPCSNASPLQAGVVTTAGNLSEQAVPLGQPFPCSSPLALRWLLPAAWQLEVTGQDAVRRTAAPLRLSWTVALEAGAGPAVRFTRCAGQVPATWCGFAHD